MRLRYQLTVAALVIVLMFSSFLAGRQFQSLSDSLPGVAGGAAGLLTTILGVGDHAFASPGIEDVSVKPLQTFQEVFSHLRSQYVFPIQDERALTYSAIRGMLAVLQSEPYEDRYTRFLPPQEYRSFLEENEGHFGGIGAEIGLREVDGPAPSPDIPEGLTCPSCGAEVSTPKRYQIVIVAPLPDTPAERAGILPGDRILKIDDTPTASLSLSEAVSRIKGRAGTTVVLTVGRDDVEEPIRIEITRAVIQVRSVDHRMLPDSLAYLRITTFNETTPELVRQALAELRSGGMRALILDLRNDSGGGLDSCIEVASQFVGEGPIVYIEERGETRQPRNAIGQPSRIDVPLAVLVNVGTASAAEILAGAIQDNGLGTLVGEKTFGKGIVLTVLPLRDGSALALSTARYLTPNLRDIERRGIEPEMVVEQPASSEYIPPLSENDEQGAAALRFLREQLRAPTGTPTGAPT